MRQEQFLDVIDRDEAMKRFRTQISDEPLGIETVPLDDSLGRVLGTDILAGIDVTSFDRSNVDGFAVRAVDTYGAEEERPVLLKLNREVLSPGVEPIEEVCEGTATPIATGGMVPRGADAIVMVEHTDYREQDHLLEVRRAVSAGERISHAGLDIARGETILRSGQPVSSREIGVLAALGLAEVPVRRRPRVAIISTGDEIVAPGEELPPGCVFDSNAAILAASVRECGGVPIRMGIVNDDFDELRTILKSALECDAVLLSGGTSKGAGDLSYRVVAELNSPGIVAHGVALKPGKPICLAVEQGKPVVILPGFPTSAIFTFHEFVAPVIRQMAGRPEQSRKKVSARLPLRVNSEKGRTEYLLVGLVSSSAGELTAYPMGKGSGSVTTFSQADGFLAIDQHTEQLDPGLEVEVQLLGESVQPADLVAIGSHCLGLDLILSELAERGISSKLMNVGSLGGLAAAKRGECDIAGIHLMDESTGEYNRPFLTEGLTLETGYRRMQGLVFRRDDPRFEGTRLEEALEAALNDPNCRMINRNTGSGTRILIDALLGGRKPPGYSVQANSHNAVAAAISQRRADWGLAIETVATAYDLGFLPYKEECYDFAIPNSRRNRQPVVEFLQLLHSDSVRTRLENMGFRMDRQ